MVPRARHAAGRTVVGALLVLWSAVAGWPAPSAAPPDAPLPTPVREPCLDEDDDGFSSNPAQCGPVDCDDDDPTAWFLADGYADRDGDGHVSALPESFCAGDSLPPGFGDTPGDDCNDDRRWVSAAGTPCEEYAPLVRNVADSTWAADFAVHLDAAGRVRVWYTRYPPYSQWQTDLDNSRNFGRQSTPDLLSWRDDGTILDVAGSGGWDDEHVWAPSLLRNPADGRWWLFYTGVTDGRLDPGAHRERIGAAVSDDLETWTRLPKSNCAGGAGDGCLFDCNLPWTAWSDTTRDWTHQCRDPHVVDGGDGTFYLAYATAPAPFTWQMQVGLAASTDLVHWTDLGPVPPTLGAVAESPHLHRRAGLWYLFWTSDSRGGIRYATAPDLAAGPWSPAARVPGTSWWEGTIASEILDAGDRLLFAHGRASSRGLAFWTLEFDDEGVPRLRPVAPLACRPVDPASIHPGAPEPPNGVDDDCDGLVDGTVARVALLRGFWGAELTTSERLGGWFAAWARGHPSRRQELDDLAYPGPEWPGGRLPGDFWRLWRGGECQPGSGGAACLDSLAAGRRVVIVAFDAEASDVLPEAGPPDPASPRLTVENARAQLRDLRQEFAARPGTRFLVWTPPPRHRLHAPAEGDAAGNADRALALARWMRDEWLAEEGEPPGNVEVLDVRALVADDDGLFLRPEYERDATGADSRPGYAGVARVVPRLGQAVVNLLVRASGEPACADLDGDGYGAPACAACLRDAADCDDADVHRNPGTVEVCGNDVDENCDGVARPRCPSHLVSWPHMMGEAADAPPAAPLAPACWAVTGAGGGGAALVYALPAAGPARVDVYDLRGARVARLRDGPSGPGEHLVTWSGRDAAGRRVAAGVYVAVLEAAGGRATAKLVVLR